MLMKHLSKKLSSQFSAQDNIVSSSIQLEKMERTNGELKNSEKENKASSFFLEKLLKKVFKTHMYWMSTKTFSLELLITTRMQKVKIMHLEKVLLLKVHVSSFLQLMFKLSRKERTFS